MIHDFCVGCLLEDSLLPECILRTYPSKVYLEDILSKSFKNFSELFVCHKFAQEFTNNHLVINDKCDNCHLCYVTCKYINEFQNLNLSDSNFENVIFSSLEKAYVAFEKLLPNHSLATEVNVDGNFRTKRIDLVTLYEGKVSFVKLLKNANKADYYSRSYKSVVEIYKEKYPEVNFSTYILIPSTRDYKINYCNDYIIANIKDFIEIQEV